jgi:hypothetical protein
MSGMKTQNQTGAGSLMLALVGVIILLIGSMAAFFWAYASRQDYKNNVDSKVAAAVAAAKEEESAAKEQEFAQRSKSPYRTYNGPSAYGSVSVKYPRTWSGYVLDSQGSDPFVDGYFSPGIVPSTQDQNSKFALRIQVVQTAYSDILNQYSSQVKAGLDVKVRPYKLPKVPAVVGSRITGALDTQKQGVMILLPVRDKTLKIWTESSGYTDDLDKIILPNLRFSP